MLTLYAVINALDTWQAIWAFVKEWYWIPMTVLYVGVIFTILSENRNPSKSLAYILVLVFLPVRFLHQYLDKIYLSRF